MTRNGKPVPHLFVNFVPDQGRPSWALADDNGRFTLHYDEHQDGAVVGTHTVWVQWRPRNPLEENKLVQGKIRHSSELAAILSKFGTQEKGLRIEISQELPDLEIKLD